MTGKRQFSGEEHRTYRLHGQGKTEVGRELNILGWKLIDADDEIVKAKNMSINDIQSIRERSSDIETEMIKNIKANKNMIISTGGGL